MLLKNKGIVVHFTSVLEGFDFRETISQEKTSEEALNHAEPSFSYPPSELLFTSSLGLIPRDVLPGKIFNVCFNG